MPALAKDFLALLFQRQAVDFHHVVEHPGKHPHHFAETVPVEARLVAKWLLDEAGEVDRAEQTRAVRRQRLLAAGLVARIASHHQLLFSSLTRSMRMKPGSA